LQLDESRVHVLNTLFDVPVTYIIACVIEYFSSPARCPEAVATPTGVKLSGAFMSYHSIFRDVRAAVDWVRASFHACLEREFFFSAINCFEDVSSSQ
jgi:5'-nucleotidase